MAPLLEAVGLTKRFGAHVALRSVGLDVREGEILGLIGPNGSGKTTLFECLAGLLAADAGDVLVDGGVVPPEARKQTIFYLPDGITPWPAQRVSLVLSLFRDLFGETAEDVRELSEALMLGAFFSDRMGTLSKGERKRVLIAVALLSPHRILLLDEPFDGLDLRQARDLMALLRVHRRPGRTLFLSIHQLADAARICDRLVLLNGGQVAGEGTLAELRARATLPASAGLEEVFLALT